MDPDARCSALAAAQFGVIHLSQARRAGLSDRQIRSRLARGLWRRLFPGVFVIAAVPESFQQRAVAAALYGGKGSAVAFEGAGYLWELLEEEPDMVDIWTPRTLRAPGIRIHRVRSWERGDVTRLGVIPITDPARTLIDLAARLPEATLEEALHAGLVKNRPSRARLERRLAAIGGKGRRGPRRLADLLALCPGGVPESTWETRFFRDLRRLGKPFPVPQHPFSYRRRRFRHDFFYADEQVAIECDSRKAHLGPGDFERERCKLNALQHMPWRVIHVTYRQHLEDRDGVLDLIAAELGRSLRCRKK